MLNPAQVRCLSIEGAGHSAAVKPREIKLLIRGQFDPVRARELQEQMLDAGLPIA
jgi:hypothetical protein